MTDCLSKSKRWDWNDKIKPEYTKIKEQVSGLKNLSLPNYERPFILRTDASNTGLGTVLLQLNENNKRRLLEWASRK